MKYLLSAVLALVVCSGTYASECSGGTCSKPVRTATKVVVEKAVGVITAPVRTTRIYVQNSRRSRCRGSCKCR